MFSTFTEYTSQKLITYRIVIPNTAKVYIACYKSPDINSTAVSDNNLECDPRKLLFSLKTNFAYGGSRLADFLENVVEGEKRAIKSVNFLALAESHMKHVIINKAVEEGALNNLIDPATHKLLTSLKADNNLQIDIEAGYKLPERYLDLKIRGSRCIILPESEEIENILKNTKHPRFYEIADIVLKKIANFLNGIDLASVIDSQGNLIDEAKINKGEINLTPDFGRFSEIADILNKFTPQVLCVNASAGGCCGKVAYTVTGILAGWKACVDNNLCSFIPEETDITFIGSAGALGEVISEYLKDLNFQKIKLCDLQYKLDEIITINRETDLKKLQIKEYIKNNDGSFVITTITNRIVRVNLKDKLIRLVDGGYQAMLSSWEVIPAIEGMYTDEALNCNGGIIISTAFGREIEHSNCHLIPSGTLFLAAHNIAVRLGKSGLKMLMDLDAQGVVFVPGQVLTLGGALTSRLEACYRSEHKIIKANEGKNSNIFPKKLAHEIVKNIIYHVTSNIVSRNNVTPWEALLEYASLEELLKLDDDSNDQFIPYDIRHGSQ